jgi:tetraacyldisaccharide 4'-kinase
MSFASLEKWFVKEVERPKKSLLHFFLFGISLFFRSAVFLRNIFFDFGLLPIYRSKKIVISVGNITLGGTGKTPFTELLVKSIGRPVAILERGYRAKKQKKEPFLITSPDEGDEAYLLSQKVEFAKVIVGKKRKNSAKFAEKLGVDYIVLDDGMQHRYLHRDIEIVLLHCKDLFGRGEFAPCGFLRDSPNRLKQANYVVVNGVKTEKDFSLAREQIEKYSPAKLMGGFYEVLNQEEFRGRKVAAFCGIGKPEEFFSLLKEIGAEIVLKQSLPDHECFEQLHDFKEKAYKNRVEVIVCTEKDYVKLADKRGIVPLLIEFRIFFGCNHFKKLVEEICSI